MTKQDKNIFIGDDRDIRDLIRAINRNTDALGILAILAQAIIHHGGSAGVTDKMMATVEKIIAAQKANKDELAQGVQGEGNEKAKGETKKEE